MKESLGSPLKGEFMFECDVAVEPETEAEKIERLEAELKEARENSMYDSLKKDCRESAKSTKAMMNAYIEEGFTREESVRIVTAVLSSAFSTHLNNDY